MGVMTTANRTDSSPAVVSSVVPQVPVTLDTKGRVRTSKEQRRAILDEFERSGESAAGFAQRTGLKYSTLARWLARYRRIVQLQTRIGINPMKTTAKTDIVNYLLGLFTTAVLLVSWPRGKKGCKGVKWSQVSAPDLNIK
jgi:hypothetical protein